MTMFVRKSIAARAWVAFVVLLAAPTAATADLSQETIWEIGPDGDYPTLQMAVDAIEGQDFNGHTLTLKLSAGTHRPR